MGTHDHWLVTASNSLFHFIVCFCFSSLDDGHYTEQTHSEPISFMILIGRTIL